MKIRKIIDICKRSGAIYLFEGENEQWISDGAAIFPLFNLPRLDESTICTVYNIDDKKRQKIVFRHEAALPQSYDFNDGVRGEIPAERGPMYLSDGGRGIIPYMTSQGVVFIDAKYLQPFADIDNGMLNLYEWATDSGQIYFAVKSGFMLVGIILPVDVINDQFVERLKTLLQQCEIALYNKKSTSERVRQEDDQLSAFDIVNGVDSGGDEE